MFTDRKVCFRLCFALLLAVATLLDFTGCERRAPESQKRPVQPPFIRYTVQSYQQTLRILDELDYSDEAFRRGLKEIPPVLLTKISSRWEEEARNIPVAEKKSLFLRLLAAGALVADEEVRKERKKLLAILKKMKEGRIEREESRWLRNLALKYRVIGKSDDPLTPKKIEELVRRVDVIPPSLILAQGAVESAWGTSRFAVEGNALFGQWSFSKTSMRPREQRKQIGDYGLARFKTPLDSIRAYMLNLNTHPAYRTFRGLRAKMRNRGESLDGYTLAATLTSYSERGEAYVDELRRIIRTNHLQWLDRAKLKKMKPVYIHPDR